MSSAAVASTNHTNAPMASSHENGKNQRAALTASNDEESTVLYGSKEAKHALHARISKSKLADEGLLDLEEEMEEGNIEYKWKLVDPTPERLEHLTSQLKWRLFEGQGEAFYEIGIEDNGTARGLPANELEKSIETLRTMAKTLGCETFLICKRKAKEGEIAELLVREVRDDKYMDVRIAVCGNVDAGKSTFIGVLTKGQLDNGRGLARVNVFNHKHEIETGRTSSVSQQILGFNGKGECVNYLASNTVHRDMTWGDIIEQSYKVISFIDLAGHEKYLKTTVSGMTGHMPDYCFLMVGANMGVTRMTKEHLGLALALKIPLIVIITKVDICPENVLQQTLSDITRILKMRGVGKMPLLVKTDDDFMTAVKSMHSDRVVPIFMVSNVTGKDLDMVRKFLNVIPPRIEWALLRDSPPEVLIDQTYFVTGVGTVVGGTVMAGAVQANETMLLGPDGNGAFVPVQIKSVHSKRVPVKQVVAGMSAGFALKKVKRSTIRKGMVLVPVNSNPQPTIYFEADVIILYHSTTIHKNYQPVIQCLTMRQSAKIVHIVDRQMLRTGDRSKVIFKFMYRPEFLKEGMRVIFREGRCKGIGILTRVAIPEAEVDAMIEAEAKAEAAAAKGTTANGTPEPSTPQPTTANKPPDSHRK